jgi:hypothetical protein
VTFVVAITVLVLLEDGGWVNKVTVVDVVFVATTTGLKEIEGRLLEEVVVGVRFTTDPERLDETGDFATVADVVAFVLTAVGLENV